jgi:hypothetical protein
LRIHDGAAVTFATRSAATTGKARSRRLATEFHVEAAEANLAGTTETISIGVVTAVTTPDGTAQDNVFLINSVVTGHLEQKKVNLGYLEFRKVDR